MIDRFNEDYLVSSPEYSSVMNDFILPELQKVQADRTVPGTGSCPIFCSVFYAENPLGTILILHGFTENAFKYSELIWSLLNNHFNVVAYDQRGHGRSGRVPGLTDPSVTHVDRFEDYVDDLSIICRTVLAELPKPWSVFSHSMGGAVTALFLEQFHDVFSAASLCAPMIAPNTIVPVFIASGICHAACLFGLGKHYPFFLKPYSGPEDFASSCATDPARFEWYDAVKASREDFHNSIPSYRWTTESVAVTRKILAAGAPESIVCPVLLSSADQDNSVMPEPQKQFIRRVPKGRQIFVRNSRHEIFRSENEVFFPWWHEVLTFLKEAKA